MYRVLRVFTTLCNTLKEHKEKKVSSHGWREHGGDEGEGVDGADGEVSPLQRQGEASGSPPGRRSAVVPCLKKNSMINKPSVSIRIYSRVTREEAEGAWWAHAPTQTLKATRRLTPPCSMSMYSSVLLLQIFLWYFYIFSHHGFLHK